MPKIKLSLEQKSEIRKLAATESPTIIAKSFNVSRQTIHTIIKPAKKYGGHRQKSFTCPITGFKFFSW